MPEDIIPKALKPGDTIAFISPSSRLNLLFAERIERAKTFFESKNYKVRIIFEPSLPSNFPDAVKIRCEEIHEAFLDPDVKAICTTIGGLTSNEILRHIDYNIIKDNPKIFCGYSDITLLHHAIYKNTGLRTFYGPAMITQWGDHPTPLEFTEKHFFETLEGKHEVSVVDMPISTGYTQAFHNWLDPVTSKTPRPMTPNPGWRWLKKGSAKGQLAGGCLPSILQLLGTPYRIDYAGKILFIESPEFNDPDRPTPIAYARSNIADLIIAGVFDKCQGLIIGRSWRYTPKMDTAMDKVTTHLLAEFDFPIVAGVDVGHSDPILTLPLGALAELDSEQNRFTLLERPVS